jgi:Na+-driven multidrug efflux pump
MSGIAFATAAATMVGMSLGQKNPARAQRCAYLAYAVGGGLMIFCGILMITLGRYPARWLSAGNPRIVDLTTRCLFITGFIQSGFAANLIFGGALRGAGDTLVVMILNLSTQMTLRCMGVIVVGLWFHLGLPAVWMVLAGELFIRGCLTFARFLQGGWKQIQV